MDRKVTEWVENEIEGSKFRDKRLAPRFQKLVEDLSRNIGSGLTVACQDWASMKAAYRFLSNTRVTEQEILAGHFCCTRERFAATEEPVLVLHDTTEFSFRRGDDCSIGVLKKLPVRRMGRQLTTCGILMHSSLVVTTGGLPLGLSAVKFWTRDKFKGTNALKRRMNPTRIPIEQKESIRWLENLNQSTTLLGDPDRCVHIGDRESDIYELFCIAVDQQTNFLFRTCVDRVAGDDSTLVSKIVDQAPIRGRHRLTVKDKQGNSREAILELKFTSLIVHPPEYKKKKYPALKLTVIEARERNKPTKGEPIVWKLITNLPVKNLSSAIEKLEWYASRWKIETFHKILKSGCRAEESRMRTAQRLANLIAIFTILSWRIFWVTMLKREAPRARPSLAFTKTEIEILKRQIKSKRQPHSQRKYCIDRFVLQVAKLGGYLARANDPPPGNIVIWRGLARLSDMQLGFEMQGDICG